MNKTAERNRKCTDRLSISTVWGGKKYRTKALSQAKSLSNKKEYKKSAEIYHKILEANPKSISANYGLAQIYYHIDRPDIALSYSQNTIRLDATSATACKQHGHNLLALAQTAEAAHYYRRAIALNDTDADNHFSLGLAEYNLGNFEKASQCYRNSIARQANHADAYRCLTLCGRQEQQKNDLIEMLSFYDNNKTSDHDRMKLGYGIAKYYEDDGDFFTAFNYLEQSNEISGKLNPYNIKNEIDYLSNLEQIFDNIFFKRFIDRNLDKPSIENTVKSSNDDVTPIFIVGMPRSGSSLVEQMISNQKSVHGAGELADFSMLCNNLNRLTTSQYPRNVAELDSSHFQFIAEAYQSRLKSYCDSSPYIVDKMPGNFQYIAMILACIPNAKIIHCHRNPIDNCASIYKNHFPSGHNYGNNLDDLSEYYNAYQRLMRHWHQTIPGRIHDVSYEALLTNPEKIIKDISLYCDIDYDPQCLEFHHNNRPVATASAAQVRQPIYHHAVGSWRRYEQQLQGLKNNLIF